MSEDVREQLTGRQVAFAAAPTQPSSDTWVKSYRYLRTAIVGLLIGLGVAVLYQTWRQGWHLLSSVSAYYYTPAQAIFVGALIGMGACMIALKGTTDVEDVLLNLGGMFAAVVAIVPTARGADYKAAVRACKQAAGPLLTQKASSGPDCPTVRALADATSANVENNMIALLVVGALGLLATGLFALRDRESRQIVDRSGNLRAAPNTPRKGSELKFWLGFGAALLLFALAAAAFWASTEWFIDHAHYIAAIGLFACIVVVAVVNARRHQARQRDAVPGGQPVRPVARTVSHYRYTFVASAMVIVAVVGIVLMVVKVITLFWLEILVAALFAVFWMVQTVEQLGDETPASSG